MAGFGRHDIGEPDVSPLQLQGPRSGEIMQALFATASSIENNYFGTANLSLMGIPLLVSRNRLRSSELGYEIILREQHPWRCAVGNGSWRAGMAFPV